MRTSSSQRLLEDAQSSMRRRPTVVVAVRSASRNAHISDRRHIAPESPAGRARSGQRTSLKMETERVAFEVHARLTLGSVQMEATKEAATEVIRSSGPRRGLGRRKRPPLRAPSARENLASHGWRMAAVVLLALIIHLNPQLDSLDAHQAPSSPPLAVQRRQQVSFAEPDGTNNTQRVAVGRSVRFKCVVNNIGEHKVAWFNKDRHILLAFDNKTIAWRERIQVSSQADSVFVLQIDGVQLSDKGHYICQLNTQPTKSLTHTLEVVMPPQIREQETTVNIEPVKEFSPVELRCAAAGVPEPVIKWRRESHTFELPDGDEDDDATADTSEPVDGRIGARRRSIAEGASSSSHGTQMAQRTTELDLDSTGAATADEFGVVDSDGDDSNAQSRFPLERHSSSAELQRAKGEPPSLMMAHKRRPATRSAKSADDFEETTTTAADARNHASTSGGAAAARPFLAEGGVLRIERVSRYDMGHYMCIASNGVPPSVAQRIFLPVSYVSPPPRSAANQTNTTRPRENNARPFGGQTSAANQQQQQRHQDFGARVQADKLPPTAPANWAGSGRSYQRHRQHKAARASAAASSAGGRAAGLGSVVTATNAALLALLAALGIGLVIYLSSSCSSAPKRSA